MNIVDAILMFAEMLVLYSNVYMYIDIFIQKQNHFAIRPFFMSISKLFVAHKDIHMNLFMSTTKFFSTVPPVSYIILFFENI